MRPNFNTSTLSFVDVAIYVEKLVAMTSMSGIVQLAFMKSLALWDEFEIYTDTIGLVVTLQFAQIEVRDFYRHVSSNVCY